MPETCTNEALELSTSLLGWYAVTTSKSLVNNKIFFFSLFNEPLALFRDKNLKAICIKDVCAHRATSFRGGEMIDNEVICPYHGARYSSNHSSGKDKRVTCQYIVDSRYQNYAKSTHLRQYPCVEKGDYIYVYYDGKALVDPSDFILKSSVDSLFLESYGFQLADYSFEEALLDFKCDWSRIVENHLDVLHIFWMHGQSLPGNDVGRHSIASFDQQFKSNNNFFQTTYFHRGKDKHKGEFITQAFYPPGRIVMYRGDPSSARYVQVLDHIPLSNNRARVIVRHYRKFFRNRFLSRAMLFGSLQLKTFYRIFSEDYLVLMTQTFNQQMGYMKTDNLRLLAEDRSIKAFLDWHDRSIDIDRPWELHSASSNINQIHQDLLMVYPPANPILARKLDRIILSRVLARLAVVLFVFVLASLILSLLL